MTFLDIVVIGLGGFVGAILRYLLSQRLNGNNPFGTLLVNLSGSLLIGIIFGFGLPKLWMMFLVSGFAGALTTFSTLQKEVIEQWRTGKKKQAVTYAFVTYVVGIALAILGFTMSR
ncbi:CrcB family protein [Sporosarcina pasteurii]|uniref:Fluoride-specific ion channel FluC n=1 Tax=Sporosarcina pasteurii TaxID=1474 RepID=A0A380C7R4_SPOPA|nr:CrcB family protein [Sporosarcina pasteurii]MDS9472970.1 CrcB family protein [Sporosarcina pasteurii]QBQ04486.1 CrcB family protein [Sporosarcina pasteurii]SUJ14536.1 camphor resistance protein CrcB [Sporosarcina pasteurii]